MPERESPVKGAGAPASTSSTSSSGSSQAKKPTAFAQYLKTHLERAQQEHPDLKLPDLMPILDADFQSLPSDEKKRYQVSHSVTHTHTHTHTLSLSLFPKGSLFARSTPRNPCVLSLDHTHTHTHTHIFTFSLCNHHVISSSAHRLPTSRFFDNFFCYTLCTSGRG